VISVTQAVSGAPGSKSRFNRLGAGLAAESATVVLGAGRRPTPAGQVVLGHQPGDPVLAHLPALAAQVGVDPGDTVAALGSRVDGDNGLQQVVVGVAAGVGPAVLSQTADLLTLLWGS
jgi:hypothetical protein